MSEDRSKNWNVVGAGSDEQADKSASEKELTLDEAVEMYDEMITTHMDDLRDKETPEV